MSALLPRLTKRENPTSSETAQSRMADSRAPDWDMTAIFPLSGIPRANVAFSGHRVSMIPRQLGPSMRMPDRPAMSASSRSAAIPSPPTSPNPALMTTAPFTPFSPQSVSTSGTTGAGTTITAMSTTWGISATVG